MGFRSYIRQFLGAILMLFRPSLPWGFAAGSGSILGIAACHRSSKSRSSSSSRRQEEKVAEIIFFYGFQKIIRQFLGAILMLFRPSLPWGFAAGSGSILGVAACHRSSRSRSSSSSRKQEEKVATSIFFYRFQKSSRSSSSSRRKQEEKVAKIIFHLFLWVSEVTLGSFWAQFCTFPSFSAMGICCWEWFDFWRRSLPPE